jgi:hypothetical protein
VALGALLKVVLPEPEDWFALGWKVTQRLSDIAQAKSVEESRQEALKLYKDAVLNTETQLDAFVRSASARLSRLGQPRWFRRRARILYRVTPNEQIQRVVREGGVEYVDPGPVS